MIRLMPRQFSQTMVDRLVTAQARASGFRRYEVDLGDMTMAYLSNTEGNDSRQVIVLLHGMSADKSAWPYFARHLRKRYRILIPDLPGHGDTGFSEGWGYTAPRFAESIKRFLDRLAVPEAHLVGNSLGGFVSAYFALMFPEATRSLTLIDPTGVSGAHESELDQRVASGKVPFFISDRADFDRFWSMVMAKPPWFPPFMLNVLCEQYITRRPELEEIFHDYHGKDFIETRLGEIEAPVLQLWGAEDRVISVSCAEVWADGVSAIETKVWPGVGHMPMLEIPADTARVVSQFLETASAVPAAQ